MDFLMCPVKGHPPKSPKGMQRSRHLPPSVDSAVDGTSKEITLPSALQNLVNGLRAGHGIISQPSVSIHGGVRPDLVPIVVCVSQGAGLTRFLTCLATLYALKEESSGDVILMHSYSLDAGMLTSLLAHSPKDGDGGEIKFEISMRQPGPDGTFLNT